jgi:hypothetical protein
MHRPAAALFLVLLAAVATAGCGGDDEPRATPRPPELTVPNESEPAQSTTGTETTEQTAPAAPEQQPGAGGGSPAPSPPQQQDTPQNDTPPPSNSPANRFERFCQQNPGACG